ncbi:MAG: hypothetical protein QM689_01600 [Oscillospiraceae bacterium]
MEEDYGGNMELNLKSMIKFLFRLIEIVVLTAAFTLSLYEYLNNKREALTLAVTNPDKYHIGFTYQDQLVDLINNHFTTIDPDTSFTMALDFSLSITNTSSNDIYIKNIDFIKSDSIANDYKDYSVVISDNLENQPIKPKECVSCDVYVKFILQDEAIDYINKYLESDEIITLLDSNLYNYDIPFHLGLAGYLQSKNISSLDYKISVYTTLDKCFTSSGTINYMDVSYFNYPIS